MKFLHVHNSNLDRNLIDNNTILWVGDTIDYAKLDRFLDQHGRPGFIVNDNCFAHYDKDFFCIPGFLEKQSIAFRDIAVNENIACEDSFNFCINKKQINRHLLLKLIEYFDLRTSHYTWSGIGASCDMSDILDEINGLRNKGEVLGLGQDDFREFFSEILSDCKIKPKFIHHPGEKFTDVSVENYGGNNVWTWNHGLSDIFQNTAISLISESITFQKVSCVTEKTGYAILGLTFPVWIGGYATAAAWNQAGFDIFEDVIDHSYQYKSTLIERCYHAFYDNLEILKDLDLARYQRQRCAERLLKNRTLLLKGHLTDYCYKEIERWPIEVRHIARSMMPKLYARELLGREQV